MPLSSSPCSSSYMIVYIYIVYTTLVIFFLWEEVKNKFKIGGEFYFHFCYYNIMYVCMYGCIIFNSWKMSTVEYNNQVLKTILFRKSFLYFNLYRKTNLQIYYRIDYIEKLKVKHKNCKQESIFYAWFII